MAAGAGTRLRPLTHALPKPLVPILNRPVLEYTVQNLKRHGVREIIFNLHNYPELIRHYFGDGSAWGVTIHYSFEPQLLGTAGGVRKAGWFLKGGTFLVMSGDGLSNIDLTALFRFHRARRSMATMALAKVDAQLDYGVTLTDQAGRIRRFVEKPRWGDVFSNEVNTGIYIFEPRVLDLIKPNRATDFGHDIWPQLLAAHKPIYGYRTSRYWCDVGNIPEYRRAQRDALDGKAGITPPGKPHRRGVWVEPGVQIARGAKLEAPCLIGAGSHIAKGCVIGAYTVIGRQAKLAPGSQLHNCVLWDRVSVGRGVRLENCVIGHDSQVRESASLYDGSVVLSS